MNNERHNMSVNEGNRQWNRFMVTTKTNELYGYTSQVLQNQKNFPYEDDPDLINCLKRTARRIHVDAYRANEIKRVDTHAKKRRGEITRGKVNQMYSSWRNGHAKKGDNKKIVLKMDAYYKSLWEE